MPHKQGDNVAMGISIGLVGLGSFGRSFADLFRSHPLVDRVALCDREPERMDFFASKESWQNGKFDRKDMYASLDEICDSDLDALAIITQPWLHAAQCVQAMESGKHVYSAVPVVKLPDGDEILDWCSRLVETSGRAGMHYMLGETTYYHPQAMFCRRKAAEGAFGDFVYGEGEYFHDVDSGCNLREVMASRLASKAGDEWRRVRNRYLDRGMLDGPMHYPTHSTGGPVCVMKAHAVKATAYGYRNRHSDPYFQEYAFSNEIALFRMSNGATVRICECREIGGAFYSGETFRIMGTRGSFRDNVWKDNGRTDPTNGHPAEALELTIDDMRDPLPEEVAQAFAADRQTTDFYGGHGGSHAYLVHEFVDAVAHDRVPAINAWEAARYMAMGVMAHKSALLDGETLDVPDWGDAPE